jgi:hypothetical protein
VIQHNAPVQTTQYFDIVRTAYSPVYGDIIVPTESTTTPTCADGSAPGANGNCHATITINKDAQQLQSDSNTPQPDHDHKPSKHKHHKAGDS